MKESIVAVIRWEVSPENSDEFIRRWQLDSDVIQTYPGALGTRLHRPLGGAHVYIGYARWQSLEHRVRAMDLKAVEHPELDLPENSADAVSAFLSIDFVQEPDIFSDPPKKNLGPTPPESYTQRL